MEQTSSAQTQLAEGWPAPPHWYKFFPATPFESADTKSVDLSEFKPPEIPSGNVTAFGSIVDMSEDYDGSNVIGSEDILFDAEGDVCAEFRRLFELFLDEIAVLFGQSAQTGSKFTSGATGRCKNIIKIYKNLQAILQLLRQQQFLIDLENRLIQQYNHKLSLINDIRQLAFDLPAL